MIFKKYESFLKSNIQRHHNRVSMIKKIDIAIEYEDFIDAQLHYDIAVLLLSEMRKTWALDRIAIIFSFHSEKILEDRKREFENFVVNQDQRAQLKKVLNYFDLSNSMIYEENYMMKKYYRMRNALTFGDYINPQDLGGFVGEKSVNKIISNLNKPAIYESGDLLLINFTRMKNDRFRKIFDLHYYQSKNYIRSGLFFVLSETDIVGPSGRMYRGWLFTGDRKLDVHIGEQFLKKYRFTKRMRNDIRKFRKEHGQLQSKSYY